MNDFDELIGADVAGEERERLLGVHELLVEAGPPPELPPDPPGRPAARRRARVCGSRPRAKLALIAAALIVLGLTFGIGFTTGKNGPTRSRSRRSL